MSTIKVDTIQDTSGNEQFTAKAWVYFNGTGTVAINGSGNVSSLTDNGTGDYSVNFSAAPADTNFSIAGAASVWAGASVSDATTHVTGYARVYVGRYNTLFDANYVHVLVVW